MCHNLACFFFRTVNVLQGLILELKRIISRFPQHILFGNVNTRFTSSESFVLLLFYLSSELWPQYRTPKPLNPRGKTRVLLLLTERHRTKLRVQLWRLLGKLRTQRLKSDMLTAVKVRTVFCFVTSCSVSDCYHPSEECAATILRVGLYGVSAQNNILSTRRSSGEFNLPCFTLEWNQTCIACPRQWLVVA
jgi:hypothetical protein